MTPSKPVAGKYDIRLVRSPIAALLIRLLGFVLLVLLVMYFIKHQNSPSASGKTKDQATADPRREISLLQQKFADEGLPVLHVVTQARRSDLVKVVLQNGRGHPSYSCDVNEAAGHWRQQALHIAAEQGDTEIIQLLIAAGACQTTEDIWGMLPIHCAAFHGRLEALKALHTAGSRLDAGSGTSAMPGANGTLVKNDAQLNRLLSSTGSNLIIGSQPIHVAARAGHAQIVRFLLDSGIKPDTKDNYGRTPLDYCKQEGPPDDSPTRLETRRLLEAALRH